MSTHQIKETLETIRINDKINEFTLIKVIGAGSFGTVYHATDGKMDFALKAVNKSKLRKISMGNEVRGRGRGRGLGTKFGSVTGRTNPIDLVRKEIAIFKKMNHPNIVKLLQVINDDENDLLYMVYEYCKNGAVMNINPKGRVEPFSEKVARTYFKQLVLGMEYRDFLIKTLKVKCMQMESLIEILNQKIYCFHVKIL